MMRAVVCVEGRSVTPQLPRIARSSKSPRSFGFNFASLLGWSETKRLGRHASPVRLDCSRPHLNRLLTHRQTGLGPSPPLVPPQPWVQLEYDVRGWFCAQGSPW